MKIAIIIPTLNRPEFVLRQLRYYAQGAEHLAVYVGDSSSEASADWLAESIGRLRGLRCTHLRLPGLNDRQAIFRLLNEVQEPYCALSGDDDYLVPRSLMKCASFLASDPRYRTAQGRGLLFTLRGEGSAAEIATLGDYWGRPCAEEDDAGERMLRFVNGYFVPLFSVHRTREFIEDWNDFAALPDRAFGEFAPNLLTIVRGKSRFVDCLHLARQAHDGQYRLFPVVDWLTSPDWQPAYRIFEATLRDALKQTGATDAGAQELVRQSLFWHLVKRFGKESLQAQQSKRIRDVARARLPGLFRIMRLLRDQLLPSDALSLATLRRRSSPYHEEFQMLHQSLAQPAPRPC